MKTVDPYHFNESNDNNKKDLPKKPIKGGKPVNESKLIVNNIATKGYFCPNPIQSTK
jgi:hypothetical protein